MKLWLQWRTGGAADGGTEPWPVKGMVHAVEPVSDRLGTGAVVYARVDDSGETQLLHAYRFNGEPGSAEKVWQISDGLEQCDLPGDLAEFMEDCPLATDLDGNSLKEFWTVYAYGCVPGPDEFARPDRLKIIMYEGRRNWRMRCRTAWTAISPCPASPLSLASSPASWRSVAGG